MKAVVTCIAASAALAVVPLAVAWANPKYPVKKDAVNPDYENGQLWDSGYIQKNADSLMGWCRGDRDDLGMKVVVDYPSFEDGFDYEMTHKQKVIQRVVAIAPWNACDHLCGFVSLDPGLSIDGFPSTQNAAVADEFKHNISTVRCVYRAPTTKSVETHVEYDAKTKTLTGYMTWSDATSWNGWEWATKAWQTPAMKKLFPATAKWIESH